VMQRQLLPLAARERLAVLLLAADGCWKQWQSHARICLRLGIEADALAEDAGRAGWLDDQQRSRARAELRQLEGGAGSGPDKGRGA